MIVRRATLAAAFSLLLTSVAPAKATEVRMLFPNDQLTEAVLLDEHNVPPELIRASVRRQTPGRRRTK